MTKDEKNSELIQRAVEILKLHAAPIALKEASEIAAYYAVFNNPAVWKPGIRAPHEMVAPAAKMTARFKRSFGS